MSSIDQQFIEFIVKSLVGKPDAVSIERSIDEKGVLLELTVDPEDLGRVIGKRGATAQSLRTLLRALGTKQDARYNLKIIDNSEGGGRDRNYESSPVTDSPAPSSDDISTDSSDNSDSDDTVVTEPVAEEEVAETTPEVEEDTPSDRISKARKELADLDDLDV